MLENKVAMSSQSFYIIVLKKKNKKYIKLKVVIHSLKSNLIKITSMKILEKNN